MKGGWRFAILLGWIATCAAPAVPQGSHSHSERSAANPAWSELQASMAKMHVAMAAVESSGDSDVDFVRLMLPHHQAAIDMAKTQLLYGKDPQMRRLAQEIITDQQSEIELMQLWLKQHELHRTVRHPPSEASKERSMKIVRWLPALCLFSSRVFAQQAPWGRAGHSNLQPRSGLRGKPDFKHGFGHRSLQQQVAWRDPARRSGAGRSEPALQGPTPGTWSRLLTRCERPWRWFRSPRIRSR